MMTATTTSTRNYRLFGTATRRTGTAATTTACRRSIHRFRWRFQFQRPLVLILFENVLQLFHIAQRLQVLLNLRHHHNKPIVRVLVVRDHAQNVIHLDGALFGLDQATALVRIRQINIDEIGEIEADIRDTGQLEALQVLAQRRPIVFVVVDVGQAVERGALLFREARPRLGQPEDARTLQGRYYGKQGMQIVQFVQLFGDLQFGKFEVHKCKQSTKFRYLTRMKCAISSARIFGVLPPRISWTVQKVV